MMSLKTPNCVSIDGDVINALLFFAKVEARTSGQQRSTDHNRRDVARSYQPAQSLGVGSRDVEENI